MKIFGAGISTETNTFSEVPTRISDFEVQRGSEVLAGRIINSSLDLTRLWGKRARTEGHEFVFGLMAMAPPGGTTVRSAYEALRDELLQDLEAALPVDIVLLNLHGAMVAEGYSDCEEDMIRRVRALVGPNAVVGVELDLHCHLSLPKIALANIVVTYKEYPHVDVNDRAQEVYALAVATKLGKIRPTSALFDCRMLGFYPTTRQPLRAFVDDMMRAEHSGGILSISFGHGFPYADLPHVGAKVLVIADDNATLAQDVAGDWGSRVYALRREIGFENLTLPMEQALSRAAKSSRWPLVVADQSDNVGGGAPGDATFVLRWLLDHEVRGAAIAILHDPEAVCAARKAGIGATLEVTLGGKTGRFSGDPIRVEAKVLASIESYSHAWPQASSEPILFPVGDVAALRCGGVDVVVGSIRCQCFSPTIFRDLGIDPLDKQILIPKSFQHFYAAFAGVAREVIYMSSPGALAPDPRAIKYTKLDTTEMYPWCEDPMSHG